MVALGKQRAWERRLPSLAVLSMLVATGVASAHDTHAGGTAVSFGLVAAASVAVSLGAGVALVAALGPGVGHGRLLGRLVPALLLALGTLSLALAVGQAVALALVCAGGGATVAWVTRGRGVSGHGCADATLGAVFLHRTVEGVLLAGIYAASAALGVVGAVVLTVHAVAETVAVGSLFSHAGRGRALAAMTAIHLGFLAGAAIGLLATTGLPAALDVAVLAAVGGVLLVAGVTELGVGAAPPVAHLES
ncbi:hypothetical protein ACFQH6_12975 [Halobacteriaceae archaeon GCM10025711]